MLDGWWRVFHQSTEYFMTGKLRDPRIAMKEEILFAVSKFSINFHDPI